MDLFPLKQILEIKARVLAIVDKSGRLFFVDFNMSESEVLVGKGGSFKVLGTEESLGGVKIERMELNRDGKSLDILTQEKGLVTHAVAVLWKNAKK